MATANASKNSDENGSGSSNGKSAGKAAAKATSTAKNRKTGQRKSASTNGRGSSNNNRGNLRRSISNRAANLPEVPGWLATVMSVVGVGVAVGAGLYATRRQWMPQSGDWRDNFSRAHADDETDYDNFDQTRNAGTDSMRDNPGDDWDDVDDMADASFPASDPPSFNPGTA